MSTKLYNFIKEESEKQGVALDELKNDEHWEIRLAVAKQGLFLEELKNDTSYIVRTAVAE